MRTTIAISLVILLCSFTSNAAEEKPFPGADENTPSRSMFCDWLNSEWPGSNEQKVMANLDFFKWLHDEYGMQLDIYLADAGNIDQCPAFIKDASSWKQAVARAYGSTDSERFKSKYPNGLLPLYEKAKSFGCRLGVWLGPDGWGQTEQDAQKRSDMLIKLCRDYNFGLFKFDAAVSWLRPDKEKYFVETITKCRKYTPDLITLNHRIDLSPVALKHMTTFLWKGQESYIDVHIPNTQTAPHHRAGALARGLVPGLQRLTEDCGVCLSSCLDYWQDDLILQAFNRCLILAPEIYGNPWLLRDDEYPKLARIFNLHRKYRDILVKGIVLPEDDYGPFAVSRGDSATRFITLRNLTWQQKEYRIYLNQSIGLAHSDYVELRQLHPTEKVIGLFRYNPGYFVTVPVEPFRSALYMATTKPADEITIYGCSYQVVRDVPAKPIIVNLLGLPGRKELVTLSTEYRKFTKATLDGQPAPDAPAGRPFYVRFPGEPNGKHWHRKLAGLTPCDVPADAEALYEATCFAANNNALEVRELLRSGPTKIPQVELARKRFFEDPIFVSRGIWDKFAFDADLSTSFRIRDYHARDIAVSPGMFRLDFATDIDIDKLVFQAVEVNAPAQTADVSADLKNWRRCELTTNADTITVRIPTGKKVKYLRIDKTPTAVAEIEGYKANIKLDTSNWRASNLFKPYSDTPAVSAWQCTAQLDELAKNSYLAVAIPGQYGNEAAYAAIRIDGRILGAPDRSPSFECNQWEHVVKRVNGNYTYYFPPTEQLQGKTIEVVVLGLKRNMNNVKPELWLTAYPPHYETKTLILE